MIPSMWMRWVHATFDPHLMRATSPAQICVKCVLKIWSDYCEVGSGTKEVYKEATIFSNLFTEKVAYISFSWGLWISMGVQSKDRVTNATIHCDRWEFRVSSVIMKNYWLCFCEIECYKLVTAIGLLDSNHLLGFGYRNFWSYTHKLRYHLRTF